MPTPEVLLTHSSAAISADGATAEFPVGRFASLAVDINLTEITGTNVTFYYERKGRDGNWYRVTGLGLAMTAAGARPASLGEGLGTNSSTWAYGFVLGEIGRIAWVGTAITTMSFTIGVTGK